MLSGGFQSFIDNHRRKCQKLIGIDRESKACDTHSLACLTNLSWYQIVGWYGRWPAFLTWKLCDFSRSSDSAFYFFFLMSYKRVGLAFFRDSIFPSVAWGLHFCHKCRTSLTCSVSRLSYDLEKLYRSFAMSWIVEKHSSIRRRSTHGKQKIVKST